MFDIISSRPDDEGFVEDIECYDVYLDGKKLDSFDSADAVLGEVVMYGEILYGDIAIVRKNANGC